MNNTDSSFDAFERASGVTFGDKTLLKTAFVHRSYLNENRGEQLEHNERLEFLGDAVLELVTTEHLYARFPKKPEGELTAIRAALVNTVSLSGVAEKLQMGTHLLLSRGEAQSFDRSKQYLLANTYEAVIGAVYLDQGYDAARMFIERTLLSGVDTIVEGELWRDAKSTFQEKAQEHEGVTPRYEIVGQSGPDHDKRFVAAVYVGSKLVAEGEGKSKQEAEQSAAAAALAAYSW